MPPWFRGNSSPVNFKPRNLRVGNRANSGTSSHTTLIQRWVITSQVGNVANSDRSQIKKKWSTFTLNALNIRVSNGANSGPLQIHYGFRGK